MAYDKTIWEPREGSNLDRFEKENETARSVILRNSPNSVTQKGTKFSVQNMNKIEQGIFDAHEMVAVEESERKTAVGLLSKADQLLEQSIAAEIDARQMGDEALQTLINLIMGLIPNQASVSNLLADKIFVNSTVSNLAAWFLTPDSDGEHQWASLEALRTGPWFSGGTPKQPTQNDYAIFINQDQALGPLNSVFRALFSNELWSPQYMVNDTPFTAAQLAALNSNITAALVNKIANPDTVPTQSSAELITSGGVFSWFGAAVSTLKTMAKNVVGAINELFDNKIDKSEKGNANGVAELDENGRVPQTQIPSVPASINRTVTTNDNATGNVTDTGGNLSIPVPVTITPPNATNGQEQLTSGTLSLRTRIQRIVDNIAFLFSFTRLYVHTSAGNLTVIPFGARNGDLILNASGAARTIGSVIVGAGAVARITTTSGFITVLDGSTNESVVIPTVGSLNQSVPIGTVIMALSSTQRSVGETSNTNPYGIGTNNSNITCQNQIFIISPFAMPNNAPTLSGSWQILSCVQVNRSAQTINGVSVPASMNYLNLLRRIA